MYILQSLTLVCDIKYCIFYSKKLFMPKQCQIKKNVKLISQINRYPKVFLNEHF